MIEAFSEQLITIDELRARMPHLRARETSLRSQIDALDAQSADRDAYLTLASDLESFLAQLRGNADTATVEDRQRVLRLLIKDILIGPEKITIRHRIPAPAAGTGTRQRDPRPDTEGDHRRGYLLRWGRDYGLIRQHSAMSAMSASMMSAMSARPDGRGWMAGSQARYKRRGIRADALARAAVSR
jgi:site-specific DNA recombinase